MTLGIPNGQMEEDEGEELVYGCSECGEICTSKDVYRTVRKEDPYKTVRYFCKECKKKLDEGQWL